MDPSEMMLPTPVQTLSFPSSFSSSRSPTSPASRSSDATSFCSSSGLIETQYPTISQIIDCATPSSSSQPMLLRATGSSASMTLEPKFEYLSDVSNDSLKFRSASGKSLPHASLVVDIPRPLDSLQSSPIPPFLSKTYEIVNDPSLDRVISWSPTGQSFVVWDPVELSRIVLPRHFKHSNFSSFLRQLNTYTLLRTIGFHKIDGDRWEFSNEEFLRGKRILLKKINRRRSPRTQPKDPYLGSSMGMEKLGAEDELEKLRSDEHMLMQEVVKIKQEHLLTIKEMDELNCRLLSAELRQKQLMSLWAKILRNPNFLMQLKSTKKLRKFASTRSIKRSLKLASTSLLQVLESNSETQLTDPLLQVMSDKYNLDVNTQNGSFNKPLEILETSLSPNVSFEGKNIRVTKEDASLGSSDFYISSPEEFSSSKIFLEPISSLSESFTQQGFQSDTFNGESVGEIQDGMACLAQYLASPVNDVSQKAVFLYSVKHGGEIACKEESWDADFEAGGSFASDHDVWDNVFCTNFVVSGDEIELSKMWDFGLHFDEGFDIGKCFGIEVSLLPDVGEDGLRDDLPKSLET